ncbi:MAG: trypsin-like peptidase domain-containing protein [Planctomycetaceae bacterium]
MLRRSPWLLCGAALVCGLALGIPLGFFTLGSSLQADPEAVATDVAFRELESGPNPLLEGGKVLSKIAALVTPSVVHIQSDRTTADRGLVEETGSGVFVTSNKSPGLYVVTNRHVVRGVEDLNQINIRLHDGRVIHPVRKWDDTQTDLAVLKVSGDRLVPARWGDSDEVQIGNMVLAVGSPFGLSQSITLGIISAKGRRSLHLGRKAEVLNQDFLQTDAAINPGNSGGPLVDVYGRIIGINTAIASNSGGNDGIGFSIPSNLVRRVVEELLEHGAVQRAFLGVSLDPDFTRAEAQRLKLDRVRGAKVDRINADTPAARAGLRVDDVILSFEGIDVQDENHLINLVSLTAVGKKVKLVIFRNGQKQDVEVLLSDRAQYDQMSELPSKPGMGFPVKGMGLTLHEIEPELATQLGYPNSTRGLLVLKIEPQSPLAGQIKVYDLIEEIARKPVASGDELTRVISEHPQRESILLKVRRRERGESQSHVVIWRR